MNRDRGSNIAAGMLVMQDKADRIGWKLDVVYMCQKDMNDLAAYVESLSLDGLDAGSHFSDSVLVYFGGLEVRLDQRAISGLPVYGMTHGMYVAVA